MEQDIYTEAKRLAYEMVKEIQALKNQRDQLEGDKQRQAELKEVYKKILEKNRELVPLLENVPHDTKVSIMKMLEN